MPRAGNEGTVKLGGGVDKANLPRVANDARIGRAKGRLHASHS